MNLDFGILWIEDFFSREEEVALQRRVTEAGFRACIDSMPNGQGLEEKAQMNSLYHRYDFILLDFRLRDEMGDELAPTVRKLFPSTTILFYSGSLSESELRGRIASKEVEGVYCSTRERFIERAGDLIEQTANSLNRLSGMRGLAMRVVAECDELMRRGIQTMMLWDDGCKEMIQELDADVIEFIAETEERYRAAMAGTLDDRFDTRAIDSGKLHKHFRRLTRELTKNGNSSGLEATAIDRLRELRGNTSKYDLMVLRKRNTLGHVRESEGPDGWVLEGGDISLADFPNLRRTFAEHIAAYREMVNIVETVDENGGDKLVHGSGGISQPRAE